jgi:hypothetical protein
MVLGSGKTMTAAAAAAVIAARAWQRMPTGSGTKGIRDYDWAMIEISGDDSPGDQAKGTARCSSAATAIPGSCPFTDAGPRSRPRSAG